MELPEHLAAGLAGVYLFDGRNRHPAVGKGGDVRLAAVEFGNDIADDLGVIGGRALIAAIVVGGVGLLELRHYVVAYVAVVHHVHVLSAQTDRSVLRHHRQRAFEIGVPDGGAVAQDARTAALEVEINHAAVLEVGCGLMVEVVERRADVRYLAENPAHYIDKVQILSEERPAVDVGRAMPMTGSVVAVGPVPETIDLHHIYLPQNARLDQLMQPCDLGRHSVLQHAEHAPAAAPLGFGHAVDI